VTEVVLVGNAPLVGDHAALVDAADLVVRFNEPRSWGANGGTRFDAWVIANSVGGRHFAVQQTFAAAPYRDLAREIWLPRAVEVHRELRARHPEAAMSPAAEQDFAGRILARNQLTQPVVRFGADFYRRCLELLQAMPDPPAPTMIPSAGFLALHHVLERHPEARITLVGFTFEGWHGHPWAHEAARVRALAAAGRLTLAGA
jgi:hypothetical protein